MWPVAQGVRFSLFDSLIKHLDAMSYPARAEFAESENAVLVNCLDRAESEIRAKGNIALACSLYVIVDYRGSLGSQMGKLVEAFRGAVAPMEASYFL
jgi:hypothetical protein